MSDRLQDHARATARSLGPARRPIRGLAGLGAFFGFGVGLSAIYATTGLGVPCPLRAVTGWECPLCGGTRLGSALLHGDVTSAFRYNPLVFIGLILATALGIAWLIETLGGPKSRLLHRVSAWLGRVHPTVLSLVLLGFSILYAVIRNLI